MAYETHFHEILKEIAELHDLKQQDYGTDDDPYQNVRGSQEWGITPWKGAMLRANDKVKRLQKFAKTGRLSNEGADDSFRDLAVYAIIALDLFRQSQKGGSPTPAALNTGVRNVDIKQELEPAIFIGDGS